MPITPLAFVDESMRGSRYLLCGVVVRPYDLQPTRRTLRSLRSPGQRRLHMKDEGNRRRRQILSVVSALDIDTVMVRAEIGRRSERVARDDCLRVLVPELTARKVGRLVVESCGQDREDNLAIRDAVAKLSDDERPRYLHASPAAEPLLWLPDIVAWAYGRGGEWRTRATSTLSKVLAAGP